MYKLSPFGPLSLLAQFSRATIRFTCSSVEANAGLFVLVFALAGVAAPAHAGRLFRCVGKDGVPQFVQTKRPGLSCKTLAFVPEVMPARPLPPPSTALLPEDNGRLPAALTWPVEPQANVPGLASWLPSTPPHALPPLPGD